MQPRGPELESPALTPKFGVAVHACNLSVGVWGAETGRPAQPKQQAQGSGRNPVIKMRGRGRTIEGDT